MAEEDKKKSRLPQPTNQSPPDPEDPDAGSDAENESTRDKITRIAQKRSHLTLAVILLVIVIVAGGGGATAYFVYDMTSGSGESYGTSVSTLPDATSVEHKFVPPPPVSEASGSIPTPPFGASAGRGIPEHVPETPLSTADSQPQTPRPDPSRDFKETHERSEVFEYTPQNVQTKQISRFNTDKDFVVAGKPAAEYVYEGGLPPSLLLNEEQPRLASSMHVQEGALYVFDEEKQIQLPGELVLNFTGNPSAGILLYAGAEDAMPMCSSQITMELFDGGPWREQFGSGVMTCTNGSWYNMLWHPLTKETGFVVGVKLGLQSRVAKNSMFLVYGMSAEAAQPFMQNLAEEKHAQRASGLDATETTFKALLPGSGSSVLPGLAYKYQKGSQYVTSVAYALNALKGTRLAGTVHRNEEKKSFSVMLEDISGEQCLGVLQTSGLEQKKHTGRLKCADNSFYALECYDTGSGNYLHNSGRCTGRNAFMDAAGEAFYMRYGIAFEAAFHDMLLDLNREQARLEQQKVRRLPF